MDSYHYFRRKEFSSPSFFFLFFLFFFKSLSLVLEPSRNLRERAWKRSNLMKNQGLSSFELAWQVQLNRLCNHLLHNKGYLPNHWCLACDRCSSVGNSLSQALYTGHLTLIFLWGLNMVNEGRAKNWLHTF